MLVHLKFTQEHCLVNFEPFCRLYLCQDSIAIVQIIQNATRDDASEKRTEEEVVVRKND
jgi:hypothetical protein